MFKKILGSFEEQKKRPNSPCQNEKQIKLSGSQLWLDQNYPKETRSQINFLEISGKGLDGFLDLVDFTNLEELYCYDNQLTGIKLANSSFNKLRVLHVGDNSFSEQDLVLFSSLERLEVLNLRNNNFEGDLEVLKGLVNLRSLDISDTNIDGGLLYLSEKLESLFCQVEKGGKCQKIKAALKDYNLGHDCYDFQSWKSDENWLVIPGSWPKNQAERESKSSNEKEVLEKKEKFFELADSIHQALALDEEDFFELEKEVEEFWRVAEEMKKEKEVSIFDNLKDQFKFDPHNLALVAEKHISNKKKIKVLEARIKELEKSNEVLAEKNEFWRFLQLELTNRNEENKIDDTMPIQNCVECGKKYEDTYCKSLGYRYDKSFGSYLCDDCRKSEGKELAKIDEKFEKFEAENFDDDRKKITYKSKNINNIMTNNTNQNSLKTFILEWEGAELKDRTMRYENFKVIVGSEKGNLLFYSTFFADNLKFKKGEVYQLTTPGNFMEDTSGTIPGSFDASGIIQGIDNGGYEFEKVAPTLLVKELWEEKEENREKWNLSEKDLEQKRNDATKINQELLAVRRELSDLQNKFSNLQLEKDEKVKRLDLLEKDLKSEKEDNEKSKRELADSKNEITQLQNQLGSLQKEKNDMEVKWVSPEKEEKFKQEKEKLSTDLKKERRENQKLIEALREMRSQGLKDGIQKKLEEKKKEQEMLKNTIEGKLGNQAYLLENLLEKQESFDLAIFEDVNQKSAGFLKIQERLQEIKVKLVSKLSPEEIEEFCQIQTEITKLEVQEKQWKEMEEKQAREEQFEAFEGVPPTTPRN